MEAQQYGVRVKKIRRHLGAPAMSLTRCKIAQLADFRHFANNAADGMATPALISRPIPGRIHDKTGH